jgi:hypothetical protein
MTLKIIFQLALFYLIYNNMVIKYFQSSFIK